MNMYLKENDPIQIILKLVGNSCNMNCTYCYEKERVYDVENYMEENIIEKLLCLIDDRPVSIQLHGGEPLLYGLDRIRNILNKVNKVNKNIKVNIQSNGLLLNDDWLKLICYEYPETELGISVDGDFISNSYRIDYLGVNQTESIEKVLNLCSQYKKNIGIISVVNDKMIGREDVVLEYFSKFSSIKAINFTPYYDKKITIEKTIKNGTIGLNQYHNFVKNVFEIWKENIEKYHFIVEPLYSIICSVFGQNTTSCHYSSFKCANVFTVFPNGNISGCDELNSKYAPYGNIKDFNTIKDIVQLQKKHILFNDIKKINEKCEKCAQKTFCREGCISSRLNFCQKNMESEYCEERCMLINSISDYVESIKEGGFI